MFLSKLTETRIAYELFTVTICSIITFLESEINNNKFNIQIDIVGVQVCWVRFDLLRKLQSTSIIKWQQQLKHFSEDKKLRQTSLLCVCEVKQPD
jgi:hypothetical protein